MLRPNKLTLFILIGALVSAAILVPLLIHEYRAFCRAKEQLRGPGCGPRRHRNVNTNHIGAVTKAQAARLAWSAMETSHIDATEIGKMIEDGRIKVERFSRDGRDGWHVDCQNLTIPETIAHKPTAEEMLGGGWKPWTVVVDAKTGDIVSTWRQPSK